MIAWCQKLIADFLAIDENLVHTERRDIQSGIPRIFNLEFLGKRDALAFLIDSLNPFCRPWFCHFACFKKVCRRSAFARVGFGTHRPIVERSAFELDFGAKIQIVRALHFSRIIDDGIFFAHRKAHSRDILALRRCIFVIPRKRKRGRCKTNRILHAVHFQLCNLHKISYDFAKVL